MSRMDIVIIRFLTQLFRIRTHVVPQRIKIYTAVSKLIIKNFREAIKIKVLIKPKTQQSFKFFTHRLRHFYCKILENIKAI